MISADARLTEAAEENLTAESLAAAAAVLDGVPGRLTNSLPNGRASPTMLMILLNRNASWKPRQYGSASCKLKRRH